MLRFPLKQPANSTQSLIVLIVILIILIILQPFLWSIVKNTTLTLQKNRTLNEQIKAITIKIRDTSNNYDNQSAYLNQLSAVVPRDTNALQVIERLETAVQGLNVKVAVSRIDEGVPLNSTSSSGSSNTATAVPASPLPEQKNNDILPLNITLSAIGPAEALVEYIDVLEHVQELSRIQKFTISPYVAKSGAKTDETTRKDFQLLMTIIFYLHNDNHD